LPHRQSFDTLHRVIDWISDHRCRVGGAELRLSMFVDRSSDGLWIEKQRDSVVALGDVLTEFTNGNIFEIGIKRGGSTAFINEIAPPRRLVALDIEDTPPPSLTDYLRDHDPRQAVRLHNGIDQGDRARLADLVTTEFRDGPLDLIVDDASHRYEPTIASFETLFPALRPGGLFLLEDWNWEHLMAVALAKTARPEPGGGERVASEIGAALRTAETSNSFGPAAPDAPSMGPHEAEAGGSALRRPLTRLAHELLLTRAVSGDVVSDLTFGTWWVGVRRGVAELDPATFRLADCYEDRFGELGPTAALPNGDR
jgi:SAM-dependent methyltransferase